LRALWSRTIELPLGPTLVILSASLAGGFAGGLSGPAKHLGAKGFGRTGAHGTTGGLAVHARPNLHMRIRFSFCCLMWCKFATFISIRYRTALTTAARFLGDSGLNVVENLLATGGASRICFAACRSKRSSVSDWRARRSTSWSPIER
jgi:hypothetical protein